MALIAVSAVFVCASEQPRPGEIVLSCCKWQGLLSLAQWHVAAADQAAAAEAADGRLEKTTTKACQTCGETASI